MDNFSILQCKLVYKEMPQQIDNAASETVDEIKWIEQAFAITMQTWLSIEKMVNTYGFRDPREEISFYKSVMPQFTGLVDYFILLYKSVLFQPDDFTGRNEYWKDELKTCREFISRYKIVCRNYSQQDILPGLRQQSSQQLFTFGVNIKLNDVASVSYLHLQSRMIALKKYMHYLKERKATHKTQQAA